MIFRRHKLNTKRVRKHFAWFPISIEHGSKHETRWLERVKYVQEYYKGGYWETWGWYNVKFVDETNKKYYDIFTKKVRTLFKTYYL